MNPYLIAVLTVAVAALVLVAYGLGHAAGRVNERARVADGMRLARSYVLSPALELLSRWIWKEIDEDRFCQGMKDYAAAKKAKHDEERALREQLSRHLHKEDT